MSADLERRALAIFETARGRAGSDRERFVAEACAGDAQLRRQVEALLVAHEEKAGFLDSPVESETAIRPELVVGQRFGTYRIQAALGRGGMGEVYLAEDSRLGRKVALKLLRAEHTRDSERLKRFEREARAASGINHPNILTVHEIGEEGSHRFMASEYVEGETLRQILSTRKMSLEEVLDVGAQVASALSAAHEAGVVHRDVKPENIMVRPDRHVKVLDFGLVKLTERRSGTAEPLASSATETGVVMGTLKYMSPEQARGLSVDERTDIFSLGVVLYEMVAGRPPFEGATSSDVLVALLEKEPRRLSREGTELPAALERVVSRALAKDASKRYPTMKDLLNELREVKRGLEVAPRRAGLDFRVALGVAMAAGLTAAAAFYLLTRPTEQEQRLEARFSKLTSHFGQELYPSLSPDGRWLLYVSDASGNNDIYLQAVGGQNPINLTEDSPSDDTTPAFSPDGERIAFRSEREGGGIFIMGRTGESPRLVAEKGFAPAWSPDGEEIAFSTRPREGRSMTAAPGGELWAVRVATREKRRLYSKDGTQPHWSPHGHRLAFVTTTERVFREIQTVAAEGAGEAFPVTSGRGANWNPVWSADGKHLYFVSSRGGSVNLWRVPIDERSGKVLGEPEPLTAPSTDVDHLTLSGDGKRIAYVSRDGRRENIQKVAFDPALATVEGEPIWLTSGSNQIFPFDLSPDANWVAYQSTNTTPLAILRADGTEKRDIGDFPMILPSWSGDGSWIAFNATPPGTSGHRNIYRSRRDGTGLEQLTDSQRDGVPAYFHSVYSPDGTRIAMHTARGKEGNAFLLDVGAGLSRPPQPFPPLTVGGEYFDPHSWSPNGEWLAGQAIDSNLMGIHHGIVLYSLKDETYERLSDFGSSATWLPDNRRLVFDWKGELHLLDRVTKATRPVYSVRPPEKLRWARLTADGRQLFFLRSIDEADIWMAELK